MRPVFFSDEQYFRLLVFAVGRDYSGYLPSEAWEWTNRVLWAEEQAQRGPPVRLWNGPPVQF